MIKFSAYAVGVSLALSINGLTLAQDTKTRQISAEQIRSNSIKAAEVAGLTYQKFKLALERNPDGISKEELSWYSLEWLRASLTASKSPEQAVKAAQEYLVREGITTDSHSP
jgi:hypothetical protein